MSGHYLSTINQDAVDAIEAENPHAEVRIPEAELPDIGATVVYIARPGEGRSGKTQFPALVLHHEGDGTLYLLVMYAADDFVERPGVNLVSDDMPWPAWRHVKDCAPEPFEPSRLNIMRTDLDAAWQKLDETISAIYGGWDAPATGSIMDYMIKFEQELKDLRKQLAAALKAKK